MTAITFPMTLETPACAEGLGAWLRSKRREMDALLHESGAISFPSANVRNDQDFESAVTALADELYTKNGEHVPHNESGTVQTPVFYPNDKKILWHNENSFHYRWPSKIFFSCILPSQSGGETPIVDSRRVYDALSPRVREMFETRHVIYVRNYVYGFGLSYQKTLGVAGPGEAEAFCRENHLRFDWRGDVLRTAAVRPAIIRHPRTGAKCFVAQCLHWHQTALPGDVREGLRDLYGEELMPRDLRWGDGSPIDDEIMGELTAVYESLEVSRPWRRGELVMLDNLIVSHARNPYVGDRKLLVALGDPYAYDAAELGQS